MNSTGSSREDGTWLRWRALAYMRKLAESATAIGLLKAIAPTSELRDMLAVLVGLEREGLVSRTYIGTRAYWRLLPQPAAAEDKAEG